MLVPWFPIMWRQLFEWWNAVYALPLALVLVLLVVTGILSLAGGVFGDSDTEHHHETQDGSEIESDADTEMEHDREIHGGDHSADHGAGGLAEVLAATFFGAHSIPVFLMLQIWLLLWGLIGLSLHRIAGATGPATLIWSVPVTLISSLAVARSLAVLARRWFHPYETSAVRRDQIVGRHGKVVFAVTDSEGTIHARDEHGTLHRIRARSSGERLEAGEEVVILGVEGGSGVYQVAGVRGLLDD